MDVIERLRELPKGWIGNARESAKLLGCSKTTFYRFWQDDSVPLAPDQVRGLRNYFSKRCLLKFAREWFCNAERAR